MSNSTKVVLSPVSLTTMLAFIFLASPGMASAASLVDLNASIAVTAPDCSLEIVAEESSVNAAYSITDAELDAGTSGTFSGAVSPANFLVSSSGNCNTVPELSFQLPIPVSGHRNGRTTYADAHGVSWQTNSQLINVLGYTDSAGTASLSPLTLRALVNRSNGNLTLGINSGNKPISEDPTKYYAGGLPQLGSNSGYLFSEIDESTNNRSFTATGYNGTRNIFYVTPDSGTKSIRISVGAFFARSGPLVGGVIDNRALVNALNYGWSGTLEVTAI